MGGVSTNSSCVAHPPVTISAEVFEKVKNGTITKEEIDMIMGRTADVTSTPAPLTTISPTTTPTPTTVSATNGTDASGKKKKKDSKKKKVSTRVKSRGCC